MICLRIGAAGLLVGAVLTACSGDFDPTSRVTKLRLLAVQADRPFAAPGEEVHLQALAHDPRGRTISWGWATCTLPPSASVTGCLAAIDPASIALGNETFTVRVPADLLTKVPPYARASALIGVVTVACPGTIGVGNTQGVPITCVENGRPLRLEEFEIGMKRVLIRERDRNANPVITAVRFDGALWPESEEREVNACDPGDEVDDCAEKHTLAVATTPAETGVDERGTAFTESVVVQYYATEGTFLHDVRIAASPETKWVARKRAGASTITVWIVARDDRGGVSWITRRVRVR